MVVFNVSNDLFGGCKLEYIDPFIKQAFIVSYKDQTEFQNKEHWIYCGNLRRIIITQLETFYNWRKQALIENGTATEEKLRALDSLKDLYTLLRRSDHSVFHSRLRESIVWLEILIPNRQSAHYNSYYGKLQILKSVIIQWYSEASICHEEIRNN